MINQVSKISFIFLWMFLLSCSKPSEKEQVVFLIKEYAKENIADYKSFEIIELSEIDSLFTKLLEQEELLGYMDKFKENITEM